MAMSVASPRKSIFQRVGFGGYSSSHYLHGSKTQNRKCGNEKEYDYDEDGTMELVQIGAERTKNVLILMSDTGGGHRASAEAIRDAFTMEFGDEYRIFVKDVWKEYTGWPLNDMERSYKFMVKHVQLWKVAFHSTSPRWIHSCYLAAIAAYYAKEVEAGLMEYKPDIIISVHPLMQHIPLWVLKWQGLQKKVVFVTVITDLNSCHPTWFHPGVNRCYCPSQEVAKRALLDGLDESQTCVFGLPIRPSFARAVLSKDQLREELEMDPDLPAVLLMGGGEGMGPVKKTAKALGQSLFCKELEKPIGQLIIICGRNKTLASSLETEEWKIPVKVRGFENQMQKWMGACDCIITKAGPGTIAGRRKGLGRASNAESWLEELALLSLPFFQRLIVAMRSRDLTSDMIESCLMHYAKKCIPGISRTNRKPSSSSSSVVSESEQRELLETVISNLPLEKTSTRSSSATRFFFGLLRTANILNVSESSKAALEKKLGSQLEQATLDDLLIPSYSYLNETLYDVDCVERILANFLDGLEERNSIVIEGDETGGRNGVRSPSLMLVGKLIDGYLSEIASDANLKPEKFCNLAMSLPDQARLFHDGLYRAVDVYLKAHPSISESDRERICGVLDCQKLTLEACTHAAQNERLPLRAVVQVLFFEQLQLRHAIAENLIAVEAAQTDAGRPSVLRRERLNEEDGNEDDDDDEDVGEAENENLPGVSAAEGDTWRAAVRQNQVLRLDMDSMRTRVHQLERECSTMRKVIEKIDKQGPPGTGNADDDGGGSGKGWRGSLTRRFGCKFKTQVCDSHEPSVVDTRRGRRHPNQRYQHQHQQ